MERSITSCFWPLPLAVPTKVRSSERRKRSRPSWTAAVGGCFQFVTRWAVEPQDLLREMRRLKPAVVHFSVPRNESEITCRPDCEQRSGIFFQGSDGRPQLISTQALEQTFGAAGSSVKL